MGISFEENYDWQLMRRAVFMASATSRRDMIVRWAICLLLIIGTPYIFYEALVDQQELRLPWVTRRLMVLGIGLYYLIAPYVQRWRMARDAWRKEQAAPGGSGCVTSQGISYGDGKDEVLYPWSDFVRKSEDKKLELIVIATASGTMVALARRFFESAQDWERAKELVQLKVTFPK